MGLDVTLLRVSVFDAGESRRAGLQSVAGAALPALKPRAQGPPGELLRNHRRFARQSSQSR
jgi:hypothetical protein